MNYIYQLLILVSLSTCTLQALHKRKERPQNSFPLSLHLSESPEEAAEPKTKKIKLTPGGLPAEALRVGWESKETKAFTAEQKSAAEIDQTSQHLFKDTGLSPALIALVKQYTLEPFSFLPALTNKRTVTLGRSVQRCALLANNQLVITTEQNSIHIFDPREKKYIQQKWDAHAAEIAALAVTPAGAVMTSGHDSRLRLWTSDSLKRTASKETQNKIISALQPLSHHSVALGFADGALRIYDYKKNTYLSTLQKGPGALIKQLTVSPDETVCAALNAEGHLTLYDVKTQAALLELTEIEHCAITKDNLLVYTHNNQNYVHVYNIATKKLVHQITQGPLGTKITSLNSMPDGMIASGDSQGTVLFFDPATGKVHGNLKHDCHFVVATMIATDRSAIFVVTHALQNVFEPTYELHIYEMQKAALQELEKLPVTKQESLKHFITLLEKTPVKTRNQTLSSPRPMPKGLIETFTTLPAHIQECLVSQYHVVMSKG